MEIFSVANNSPIHRLNHDLLLHIFEQNAHMFTDDNALITTRTASQVCQEWRSLLLATPFLWGRLLDFDVLARSTGGGYWGETLVRRSGSAVLWIEARESLAEQWPNQQLVGHFLNTVEGNFHRLQILVVDVDGVQWMMQHYMWNKIISLPAPQLITFDLTVASRQLGMSFRTPLPGRSFSLPAFADKASCLRKFKAVKFKFNLRAPWVQGLRDLYIGHPVLLSEILDALANAGNLERLEIHGDLRPPQDVNQRLQPIRLPKLRQLCLFFDPSDCIALLHCVKTPPDCALQCVISRTRRPTLENWHVPDVTEEMWTASLHMLSGYARRYFQLQVPTKLMFHYQTCVLCITSCPEDGLGGIHMQIERDLMDFTEQIKTTFLSEFTLPEFLHVTELRLQILDSKDLSAVSLLPFLGCLPLLQVLTICDRDIRFFEVLKENLGPPRVILPSLQTIIIQPNRWSSYGSTEEERKLATSEFADALNKDGYPVEVICSQ